VVPLLIQWSLCGTSTLALGILSGPPGLTVVFLSFLSVCERALDGREDLKLSYPGVFVGFVPVGMVQERKLLVCSLNLGKGGVDLHIQQTIKLVRVRGARRRMKQILVENHELIGSTWMLMLLMILLLNLLMKFYALTILA
jgi:hypothetical protein